MSKGRQQQARVPPKCTPSPSLFIPSFCKAQSAPLCFLCTIALRLEGKQCAQQNEGVNTLTRVPCTQTAQLELFPPRMASKSYRRRKNQCLQIPNRYGKSKDANARNPLFTGKISRRFEAFRGRRFCTSQKVSKQMFSTLFV